MHRAHHVDALAEEKFVEFRLDELMSLVTPRRRPTGRDFIGRSDARIITNPDEALSIQLRKEKRGYITAHEAPPTKR
jgi:hypothetical protein